MINLNLLLAFGASYKKVEKGTVIYQEGGSTKYYYQLVEGRVKLVNISEAGKEFIQNIIEPGESFGEMCLFDDGVYAATCIAEKHSILIQLKKNLFYNLLKENPSIHLKFTQVLAERLRYKFFIVNTIASENPEARVHSLLKHLKKECKDNSNKMEIKLTRQQIANMTGLCVETVIREIKKMDKNHFLTIEHGKVFV